ncbi:MAG: hypothetical protein AB1414_05760 [bacterium]
MDIIHFIFNRTGGNLAEDNKVRIVGDAKQELIYQLPVTNYQLPITKNKEV